MTTMTQAQIQTFATDIQNNTDQEIIDAVAKNESAPIQSWYNEVRSPDFWVFKSSVTTDEARDAIVWSEVLAPNNKLPDEERWAFDTLMANGNFDPSSENNRIGITKIFEGGGFSGTRNNMLDISTRLASRVEEVFAEPATGPAGGDGSSNTSVALAVYVGPVDRDDVEAALEIVNP